MDALADTLAHEARIASLNGYCTGLLLPLERKTMEMMAAHLAPERTLAMQHRLQNFITDAPWDDDAVLATVRAQVLPTLAERGAIRSWIVDDTSMPKKGKGSVGVARQYCGQLGKVDNCQSLVTLSVANATAALPIAARLYLPDAWAQDEERRAQVGVPLDVAFQTKPAIALEQIRAAHAAGVPKGVVLADEAYGANGPFRRGLAALGLRYAIGVPSTLRVLPPHRPPPRPPLARPQRAAERARSGQPPAALGLAVGDLAGWHGTGADRAVRHAAGARWFGRRGRRTDPAGRVAGGRACAGGLLVGDAAAEDHPGHRRRHGQGSLVGGARLP